MHCYCAGPSTGTLQYLDRQPVTTRTDATHRMVDPSRSVTSGVQPLGRAMDRSFCHIQQQEGPAVHISITGSLGSLHWCSVEPYEPDGHCVCLPTVQNHPNSHSQIQTESTTIILIALYRMTHHGCRSFYNFYGTDQFPFTTNTNHSSHSSNWWGSLDLDNA